MNTKHTPGPFAVGDYATSEQIDAAIRAAEVDAPLGARTYGAAAARLTILTGEDAQWAVQAHCRDYPFPLTKAEDIAAVLLYGNEDAPHQVWGTSASEAPTIFHEFERLA